ncbi:hypothetical protein ACLD9W_00270 [Neisseria sp. WLZKY-1]|uniref:hypothetical protein n=1 Tax=Neisseria sp. WLZKY-1 TaxID=3390377 RepID=UPI003978749B
MAFKTKGRLKKPPTGLKPSSTVIPVQTEIFWAIRNCRTAKIPARVEITPLEQIRGCEACQP